MLALCGWRAVGQPRATWAQAFDLLAVEPPARAVGIVSEFAIDAATGEAQDAWVSLGDCIAAILHGGGRVN